MPELVSYCRDSSFTCRVGLGIFPPPTILSGGMPRLWVRPAGFARQMPRMRCRTCRGIARTVIFRKLNSCNVDSTDALSPVPDDRVDRHGMHWHGFEFAVAL